MRIMLDLDGVLYDWDGTAKYLLERYWGYSLGETYEHDYIKHNIEREHWDWLWTEGMRDYGLFKHGHSYRGSVEAVRELHKIADLVVATKRPKRAAADTFRWLADFDVPFSAVHLLGSEAPKSSIRPPCNLMIDDQFTVCNELAANTGGTVLLWDRPWNQGVPDARVQRVKSWSEVITIAEEIQRAGEALSRGVGFWE